MFVNEAPVMPAEHLHSRDCLAAAMICAIENLRDQEADLDEGALNHAFRMDVQDNTPLTWADEYLVSGTATCRCSPQSQVKTLLAVGRRDEAQHLAEEYLGAGRLTCGQYIDLVKWSEGR